MRILFTAFPSSEHVSRMLPLARAAYEAGHLVRFATGPDVPVVVGNYRIARSVAGPSRAVIRGRAADRYGDWQGARPARRLCLAGRGLFGDPVRERLTDLERIAEEFRPHLIVHDVLELAGHLLAADLGTPVVAHGISPVYPAAANALFEAAFEAVDGESGSRALAEYLRSPYLDIASPALLPDDPMVWQRRIPLRINASDGCADDLEMDLPAPRRPRAVHVISDPAVDPQCGLCGEVAEALLDLPVHLFAYRGSGSAPGRLGERPDGMILEGYEDPRETGAAVAPTDVVVTSGESGAVLDALGHGLAQVVIPRGCEREWNAVAVAGAGAAVVVKSLTPEEVRHAVRTALSDPWIAQGAHDIQAEIERLPSAGRVIDLLEDYTFSVRRLRTIRGAAEARRPAPTAACA